jgi:hypothetical protein
VPRHVARLVAPLVVDYSASRRLVVDYFASAARPGASARRAARHAARRAARRRLLRLCRASGCFSMSRGTSRGSSRLSSSTTPPRTGSSSTTSPPPRIRVPRHVARLVTRLIAPLTVDYFDNAARPVASACRAARHAARRAAHRRILRLCHASGCFGMSRGTSRGSSRGSSHCSSSTTSTAPCVRLLQHVTQNVARLVTPLIIDYFASHRLNVDYFTYTTRPGVSARRAASQTARRRLLRAPRLRLAATLALLQPRRASRLLVSHNTGSTLSTPRAAATSSSGRIVSTIHLD